jgi:hypothetical protein
MNAYSIVKQSIKSTSSDHQKKNNQIKNEDENNSWYDSFTSILKTKKNDSTITTTTTTTTTANDTQPPQGQLTNVTEQQPKLLLGKCKRIVAGSIIRVQRIVNVQCNKDNEFIFFQYAREMMRKLCWCFKSSSFLNCTENQVAIEFKILNNFNQLTEENVNDSSTTITTTTTTPPQIKDIEKCNLILKSEKSLYLPIYKQDISNEEIDMIPIYPINKDMQTLCCNRLWTIQHILYTKIVKFPIELKLIETSPFKNDSINGSKQTVNNYDCFNSMSTLKSSNRSLHHTHHQFYNNNNNNNNNNSNNNFYSNCTNFSQFKMEKCDMNGSLFEIYEKKEDCQILIGISLNTNALVFLPVVNCGELARIDQVQFIPLTQNQIQANDLIKKFKRNKFENYAEQMLTKFERTITQLETFAPTNEFDFAKLPKNSKNSMIKKSSIQHFADLVDDDFDMTPIETTLSPAKPPSPITTSETPIFYSDDHSPKMFKRNFNYKSLPIINSSKKRRYQSQDEEEDGDEEQEEEEEEEEEEKVNEKEERVKPRFDRKMKSEIVDYILKMMKEESQFESKIIDKVTNRASTRSRTFSYTTPKHHSHHHQHHHNNNNENNNNSHIHFIK